MTTRPHAFARAEYTAHEWLNSVARHLGTYDGEYTYRVLRAWLHTVRDRLTVESAVHLAAQLPELLRGVFYDGWAPNKVPLRIDVDEAVARFSQKAKIPAEDVHRVAAAISVAMRDLFSPGQLDTAFAQTPGNLRMLLQPDDYRASTSSRVARLETKQALVSLSMDDRVSRLEHDIQALTEAVRTLAAGLEQIPVQEPAAERTTKAARQAHQMLLATEPSES